MSLCRRRCLFVVATIAWAVWLVVLTLGAFGQIANNHLEYGTFAIAVMTGLAVILYTVTAPILAALRALVAADARECPRCALRTRVEKTAIPIVPNREHSHTSS